MRGGHLRRPDVAPGGRREFGPDRFRDRIGSPPGRAGGDLRRKRRDEGRGRRGGAQVECRRALQAGGRDKAFGGDRSGDNGRADGLDERVRLNTCKCHRSVGLSLHYRREVARIPRRGSPVCIGQLPNVATPCGGPVEGGDALPHRGGRHCRRRNAGRLAVSAPSNKGSALRCRSVRSWDETLRKEGTVERGRRQGGQDGHGVRVRTGVRVSELSAAGELRI
mmetsp:Transcript_43151/g.91815  ORF Transcript_43151/g.91815 Transcript_43151/m.91815 type:complete len:222 (+) Transcript_43151:671-1336(+)